MQLNQIVKQRVEQVLGIEKQGLHLKQFPVFEMKVTRTVENYDTQIAEYDIILYSKKEDELYACDVKSYDLNSELMEIEENQKRFLITIQPTAKSMISFDKATTLFKFKLQLRASMLEVRKAA